MLLVALKRGAEINGVPDVGQVFECQSQGWRCCLVGTDIFTTSLEQCLAQSK